jgi:type IV pilus assembly protein PilV
MPTLPPSSKQYQRGTTLVEVLVTMVILAFGLLGIAAFQAKAQVGSVESYQRAQAVVLLEDLQARISTNTLNAASYVTTDPVGTDDDYPEDCTTLPAPISAAERDLCEWSAALKGSSEKSKTNAKVGAMEGARGCIKTLQTADPAAGVCRPAVYQLAVAWQGLHPTVAPAQLCGKDLYGADTNRRTISVRLSVGLPTCK